MSPVKSSSPRKPLTPGEPRRGVMSRVKTQPQNIHKQKPTSLPKEPMTGHEQGKIRSSQEHSQTGEPMTGVMSKVKFGHRSHPLAEARTGVVSRSKCGHHERHSRAEAKGQASSAGLKSS